MNNIKHYFYSPLIGAIFSALILCAYSIITTIQNSTSSILQVVFGGIVILPILLAITYIVSFSLFSLTNQLIKLLEKRYIISQGLSWFIGFLLGLSIAIVLLVLNHISLVSFKGISIILSISLGLMFNMSLYSVLSGKIKSK